MSLKNVAYTPAADNEDAFTSPRVGDVVEESANETKRKDNDEEANILRSQGEKRNKAGRDEAYVLISSRTPGQQLRSHLFILLTIFFTFYLGKNAFVMTTARDFLAYLGDDEKDNVYLAIYTMLMPASILVVPLVDVILTKYGFHGGLQTVNILAIAHGLIQVTSDSLRVQVVGFVVFSVLRCFIFAITFNVLASFIAPDNTGKAAGVINLAAVIGIFLNIPLTNLAVLKYDGSFFVPNLIYTVGPVLFIFVSVKMKKLIEQNDAARNAPEEGT